MTRIRALRIAAGYAVIAGVWILASDTALVVFGVTGQDVARVSLLKGFGFVVVTSLALYLLTDRFVRREQERDREHRRDLERQVRERTAELEQVNEQLRIATEAKSAFLATMSHELRTPLNSIIGFTGLLTEGLSGPLTDQQREQLGIVRDAGKHLLTLIDDILDLSKIEAGRVEIRRAPVTLGIIVDSIDAMFAPIAAAEGIKWRSVRGPGLPAELVTDRTRVEQVLANLVGNAFKYTDEGSVSLEVTADGGCVRFAVKDTGPGIPESEQERIFAEFVRLGESGPAGPAEVEGSGLGLAIAARLARLLCGHIELISAPGEGATFTFVLPTGDEECAEALES